MKLRLFHVDAFADRLFSGNPAAVCPLAEWLPDGVMQSIAAENNLSETAFFVPRGDEYELRWFTPLAEVDLCGHATLGSAFVIFKVLQRDRSVVRFSTKSGVLEVNRDGDLYTLDLPSLPPAPCAIPHGLTEALGKNPVEMLAAKAFVAVMETEAEIRNLTPDFAKLARLPRTMMVTAPGDSADFVSRYFAPSRGVAEDPVTGSAHCTLTPYWSARLGKTKLVARQLSRRGGELRCELRRDRVLLAGRAILYLQGTIDL